MTTEKRLFRAYGEGCARGTLLYAAIAIVVFGGFCCLSAGAYILPVDEEFRLWVWVGLIVLFMFTVIGGTAVWAVLTIRRRGRELDEVFLPLGLEGRGYLTNGRQYHGAYRGYPMHVYFYRGPTLQIYLDLPLGTRVGIGRKGAIARLAADLTDKKPLPVDDPEFEHLVIYPDDRQWAAELFADPQARAAVLRLTNEEAAAELRTLSVTPNALLWQSRYIPVRNIHAENMRAWANDLYELARIAQDLTPPAITAVESGLERTSRANRSRYTWPVAGITCGVFAVIAACGVVMAAVIIILAESGL
jgi:hypothetical protein